MAALRKFIITSVVIMGLSFIISGRDASAAATPKMNFLSKTLSISVKDGGNTYGKTTLKIKNKKKLVIKKISFTSKNYNIAKVSKKGIVTAQSPGKTKIIATVKFRNKSTNNKIKKKKITISIAVKAKYKNEIPNTEMRYDETGKAEALYPFTPLSDGKGVYSNDASYIDRFPVYVETDYDTDQDGKKDLIMAFIQVPHSAVEGYYKAPVIMEANPYLVNGHRSGNETEELLSKIKKNAFDYDLLMRTGESRGSKPEISTADAVKKASGWVSDLEEAHGYRADYVELYSHFLVRGYAFVTSPGLGGSEDCEGLQCCGERVEALAYAAIVEWLHGDRVGYSDKKGTKQLRADWCNGHTAITGLSYVGTMAYEVATTGVEGLDTVIPVGAISNWYDYANTQGIPVNGISDYMSYLGDLCAKRFYYYDDDAKEKTDSAYQMYLDFLHQRNYDEVSARGQYNDYWARYNYTKEKLKVPALLVEGLNDDNVDSKQTEMMRKAFVDNGCACKVIYHQGRHDLLTDWNSVIRVNGECYDDLIDRWLAHYMAGIDNGIEKMKDYTVQSNVDGSWTTYNAERNTEKLTLVSSQKEAESTVKFDVIPMVSLQESWMYYLEHEKGMHTDWEMKAEKDLNLSGGGVVHIRAKMPDTKKISPAMAAILYDECDEEFEAPFRDLSYGDFNGARKIYTEKVYDKIGGDTWYEADFDRAPTMKNMICSGVVNLRMPNAGWESESCKEPETPLQNDTYYDYNIYLNPTDYTVKKGHRLHLYITTFNEPMSRSHSGVVFETDYITKGNAFKPLMSAQYEFTIDNKNSYAELPVVKQ